MLEYHYVHVHVGMPVYYVLVQYSVYCNCCMRSKNIKYLYQYEYVEIDHYNY